MIIPEQTKEEVALKVRHFEAHFKTRWEQAASIADQIEPRYRDPKRSYSCTGHVAKLWSAAYSGAIMALGGPPIIRKFGDGHAGMVVGDTLHTVTDTSNKPA